MIDIHDSSVAYVSGYRFIHVSWMLGSICNYSCSYCPSTLHDGKNPYHSVDAIINTFNKLPNAHVLFMGGEPTHYKYFDQILLRKPQHIKISLLSNGAKPIAFWKQFAKEFLTISLTFHPEHAKLDHFLEVSNYVYNTLGMRKRWVYLMMLPGMWDYCLSVYDKFIENNIPVEPKVLLERGKVSSLYSSSQLKWITERTKDITDSEFIGIYDKYGELLEKVSPNNLLASKMTNYFDWECFSPLEHISVDADGSIYDSVCAQRRNLGSVYGEFEIPKNSVVCKQKMCFCQGDLQVTKVKQEYKDNIVNFYKKNKENLDKV